MLILYAAAAAVAVLAAAAAAVAEEVRRAGGRWRERVKKSREGGAEKGAGTGEQEAHR